LSLLKMRTVEIAPLVVAGEHLEILLTAV